MAALGLMAPNLEALPVGDKLSPPRNQHKTNPALLGQLVSTRGGGGRVVCSLPRRGGGWRRQLAGVLVGAGPWEERGL